jgi:5-(carboxyamino)imidazole ribonucleotide mutase
MRTPSVAVIMGSSSDWNIMNPAGEMLEKFAIHCESRVISAHRGTDLLVEYARGLRERGFILAIPGGTDAAMTDRLQEFRRQQEKKVLNTKLPPQ